MKKPWRISDCHIGDGNIDYPRQHAFLDRAKQEAESLGVLGDWVQLITNTMERIMDTAEPRALINHYKMLAEYIDVWVLVGNHDWCLQDYKKELAPIRIITQPWEDIHDDIYYAHGWEFDLNIRTFTRLHWWLARHFPKLLYCLVRTPGLLKPIKEEQYSRCVGLIHAEALLFARRKKVPRLAMGHTHSPQIMSSPTLPLIMNCGDRVDSNTVLILDRVPRLRVI